MVEYLGIREAKDAIVRAFQNHGSRTILSPNNRQMMVSTIELDDQSRLQTDEVSDIAAYAVLTAKLGTLQRTISQLRPKEALGRRGVASQVTRSI